MGSLSPTFVPARHVRLAVKLPSAFALLRVVSIHPEGTFGRLRYPLGGDRPSQTTRLALSARWLTARHERQNCARVVFHRCLPLSPSPLSRQRSSRYSLRAGRNLPDKEFRYLRTVIVTAAVHRGFPSPLRSRLRFTFRHWAGVSPYTSAFAFAETCVFGKQSLEPLSCVPLTPLWVTTRQLLGLPFFQRYGVSLPSSLTEVRSSTCGYFPSPTGVGVRYGQNSVWLEAFLGGLAPRDFRPIARTRPSRHAIVQRSYLLHALRTGNPSCPFDGLTLPTASPLHSYRRALVQDYPTCSPSPTTITSSA